MAHRPPTVDLPSRSSWTSSSAIDRVRPRDHPEPPLAQRAALRDWRLRCVVGGTVALSPVSVRPTRETVPARQLQPLVLPQFGHL